MFCSKIVKKCLRGCILRMSLELFLLGSPLQLKEQERRKMFELANFEQIEKAENEAKAAAAILVAEKASPQVLEYMLDRMYA